MIESIYAIVDAEHAKRPLELAFQVLNAGCAIVQMRTKRLDDAPLLEIASKVRSACAHAGVPFVMNDRADIAKLVEADGLHLGQDDLSIEEARQVVGEMQVGVSTHSLEQAIAAQAQGADLIAFGPVFPTKTKENPDPTVGLGQLKTVCASVSRPVVAIGGISPQNAEETLQTGAAYLAVISALPQFLAEAR